MDLNHSATREYASEKQNQRRHQGAAAEYDPNSLIARQESGAAPNGIAGEGYQPRQRRAKNIFFAGRLDSRMRRDDLDRVTSLKFLTQAADQIFNAAATRRIVPSDDEEVHSLSLLLADHTQMINLILPR